MKEAQKRKVNDDFTSVASPLPHLDSQAVHASQVVYSHLCLVSSIWGGVLGYVYLVFLKMHLVDWYLEQGICYLGQCICLKIKKCEMYVNLLHFHRRCRL